MPVSHERRLILLGCTVPVAELRELIARLLARSHPTWNDEDLMHHPKDAVTFCQLVRQFEGCSMLPDELILRILSGTRKQSLPVADELQDEQPAVEPTAPAQPAG